jgi:hypothetical protein
MVNPTSQGTVMSSEGNKAMRERQVIEALQKAGDQWIGRSSLAKLLGRNKLYPLDLEALAVLEATGRIEVDRRPDPRPAGYVALYRIKEAIEP